MSWIDRIRTRMGRPRPMAGRSAAHAEAPPSGEVAWADGLFFGHVAMERWNPDALQGRHGADLYRRMLHDDQIRALVALRQASIASRGWRFLPASDDSAQHRCAAFLRFQLEQALTGSFPDALGHLLTSQVHGFSLLEKVYAPFVWEGRTVWGLRALKLRPPETFTFEVDAHGNRTGLIQQQGARRVRLDPARFVHHVNRADVHAQYGESDLRACYRHWWSKEHVLKFWNIYVERMAAGFVHGRVTGNLAAAEQEELRRALRNLNAQSAIVTPGSVELDVVTAPSTDAFERAVAARDKAMARALLVPNLLGFSEQGQVGSYSQSRTQLETFLTVMNGIAASVADTLNEQLFRELARWNFGLSDPPRFAFDPLTAAQRREVAQAWQQAVQGGTVSPSALDERTVRDLLGFPAQPSTA